MRKSKIAFAMALMACGQSVSYAQQVFEEISVVAQKREQSVQDVGIAITALTGDQLEALGFDNAQQVTAMAPGYKLCSLTAKQTIPLVFVASPIPISPPM